MDLIWMSLIALIPASLMVLSASQRKPAKVKAVARARR